MILTVKFEHTEEIVPKRCRKPRPVKFDDGEHTVGIPELEDREAPIAAIEREKNPWDATQPESVITYRWYDGRLYANYDPVFTFRAYGQVEYPTLDEAQKKTSAYASAETTIEILNSWAASLIVVDGIAYATTTEPVYDVSGTVPTVDYGRRDHLIDYYWRITEHDEALRALEQNTSKPEDCSTSFEIFIPAAFTYTRPKPMMDPVTGITRGEWREGDYSNGDIIACFDDRPDEKIAEIAYGHRGADLRLFTAAPDLYAAVRRLLYEDPWPRGAPSPGTMAALESALRKAEGRNGNGQENPDDCSAAA